MPSAVLGPIPGFTLLGGATAFPDRELTNEEVLRSLPDSAWGRRQRQPADDELSFLAKSLEQTQGVSRRRWASESETTLELAIRAGGRALEDANTRGDALRLLLCSTSTPHRMTSTLSAPVGAALGASTACMDVRTGCAAGLFALGTCALYVAQGNAPALMVGSETFSKILPPNKVAAVSLADGAGALVFGQGSGALLSAVMESDGHLAGLVTTDGKLPPTAEDIARGGYRLTGMPDELSRVVPEKYVLAISAALEKAKLSAQDIDLFVPHQTSRELIVEVCRRTGVPFQRAFVNIDRHANIGVAGWMAALVEARAENRIRPGMNVLLAAVGGGMSWAAAVLRT
jgi:3-oxoacyl-[acyl-carrier-protein] synthase-3